MNSNLRIQRFFILTFTLIALIALVGCSGAPTAETKKGPVKLDKIQGKVQVNLSETTSDDTTMNAGGQTVYLWEGTRRYRLFFKTPYEVKPGTQYTVEGIWAQRMIDEIGDPDQGKDGYPLQSSCEKVVTTVWTGMAFDVIDGYATLLRNRVHRYPARPVFLVTRIQPVEGEATKEEEKEAPEISVPAEKQKASLLEGTSTLPAPLWEPTGGTVSCKVIVGTDGKIKELETGKQLCEAVPWNQFKYKPAVQGSKPAEVKTEVEVLFEPRNKS